MDFMKDVPDKFYDLAIVDPPYGIGVNKMTLGKGKKAVHKNKNWDNSIPKDQYFKELIRVSKNQIIWGGNYFPLELTKSWVFWDKGVPEGVSFADGELAWTSFDVVLRKAKIPYSGFNGTEGKIHPTQKPVKLYEWLLMNYAKEGDKILDTHGGSQSSRIACYNLCFSLDIIELDKEYFDQGNKRFDEHKKQLTLF
jgi:site-specific DNA-methyltransferase (adenine-specific)